MAYKATIFLQVLQIIPGLRLRFEEIVHKHQGDKRARRLHCWTLFGAMMFGQLLRRP